MSYRHDSFARGLCMLLAALLLVPLFPASAEQESTGAPTPFSSLYQAGEYILTGTDNVTARGQADFYLDGKLFKHAEGVCAQEGFHGYQQIDLRTPREDGSFRENGYAVVDHSGIGYLVERYLGRTRYDQIFNVEKNQILRPSVATRSLLAMGRQIAAELDEMTAAEVSGGGAKISFAWQEEDVPLIVSPALNIFFQEAVKRYFLINYDDMPEVGYATIEDYMTITEGILYNMKYLTLTGLRAEAELDSEGRLRELTGSASIRMLLRNDDTRTLEVSFSLTADHYGDTLLSEVIPEENQEENLLRTHASAEDAPIYFGTIAGGGGSWSDVGLPEIPLSGDTLEHRPLSSAEDAVSYAAEAAAMGQFGIEDADRLLWTAAMAGDGLYEAAGAWPETPDTPAILVKFSESGHMVSWNNLETGFDLSQAYEGEIAGWTLDSDTLITWRQEIDLMIWMFEENLNPGSTRITDSQYRDSLQSGIGYCGYEETRVFEDQTFVVMYGNLNRDPYQKVKYVVQTSPSVRIVLRDETIDPLEGGLG